METSLKADERLSQLESKLDRLQKLYDQYFAGVNKILPTKESDDFAMELRRFRMTDLVSTSQKFRFANTKSRYQQLKTHWERTVQQIEEGRFIREKSLHRLRDSAQEKPTEKAAAKHDKDIKALETLYSKLQQTRQKNKVMAKDKFFDAMQKQLDKFRQKNPGASPRFRLSKDASGKTQVKIEKKQ